MDMTSDASHPTSSATDHAWHEIDGLIEDLGRLSASELPPADFYARLMDRVVPALAAVGAAVWTGDAAEGLKLEYQVNLPSGRFGADGLRWPHHARLVESVLETGQGKLVPPGSGPGASDQAANPTEFLLVLAPWACDEGPRGVLEVLQRADASPAAQRGYLQLLTVVCELVSDFHRNRQLRGFRHQARQLGQFDQFVKRIHESLDLKSTAYEIANGGRRLIGCDRVSVAVRRGSKYRIAAVSGVETFNPRGNVVRELERLCKAVSKTGEPFWHLPDEAVAAPQIEELLSGYLDLSHVRLLAVIPLLEPETDRPSRRREVIGALVVERFQAGIDEHLQTSVSAVCNHGSLALHNALTLRSVPFARLLTALAKARWFVRARQLPKTLLALLLVAAAVFALVAVPADFKIEARGELQPLTRCDVFAPCDGVVYDLQVGHGEEVAAGKVLLHVRNVELDFELQRISGELNTAKAKLDTVETERKSAPRETAEQRRRLALLTAEQKQLEESISGLEQQYEILERRKGELEVRSPIDGEVLTWNLNQLLEDRPVSRGQILMTVADREGPWVLELRVPDDRIAHVLAAQKEIGEDRDVSFVLATDPGLKLKGKIERVGMRTEVAESEDVFVLVTVSVDREQIPEPVPGATVSAKIDCGRRPIGYVWLHDLIEAVQYWILF